MKNLTAKILFVASVVSYIVSLCVPAFYDAKSPQAWLGLAALISGVFGLFDGLYCWLANPLIVAVWIAALIKRPVLVICGASLGCALCLSFLRHDWIYVDEAGNKAPIVGLGPGFWLWFLAPLLMVFYGLLLPKEKKTTHAAS
jgi:hypothetical protein